MSARDVSTALSDGVRDSVRFWPMLAAAFVHAIVSCLLLGLALHQVTEARAVSAHLSRWERDGAAVLRGLYLASPDAFEAPRDLAPEEDGRAEMSAPLPATSADSGGGALSDDSRGLEGEHGAALLALLADPARLAYTVDFYGDRFGDDVPGALIVTEDFLAANGLEPTAVPSTQAGGLHPLDSPRAVLGSDSMARDPYALASDGASSTTRVPFLGEMIPVVGRLGPGADVLDPQMGPVSLDQATVIVVPAEMLPQLYDRFGLDALLLRSLAVGPGAVDDLRNAAASLESPGLSVAAEPLGPQSSPLLQSLNASARTLTVLFGAAVLGAAVSLFGALGVLARALGPTWRIAITVGAARWQALLRIAVPVALAWILPAMAGLAAGAALFPAPPSPALALGALGAVTAMGGVAVATAWGELRSLFQTRSSRETTLTGHKETR